MTNAATEYFFDSREKASAAVATKIVELCARSIERQGDARIVVSGGTTPTRCFELLSGKKIAWEHVQVLLSDERWVAVDDDNSNERLVREKLLVGDATAANLLPLYQADMDIDERADSLQAFQLASGFACSMLGMGVDGHFASLFPQSDAVDAGLNPEFDRFYVAVRTASSPHPRLSMTLSALIKSDEILLLFFGDEKMSVYKEALTADSELPIAHLLHQTTTPVSVYWSR